MEENALENIENYQLLATSIIEMACKDFEAGLRDREKCKGTDKKLDPAIQKNYNSAVRFFKSDWYNELSQSKDITGEDYIKAMRSNFKKYGKCILLDDDWDKINRSNNLRKGNKI